MVMRGVIRGAIKYRLGMFWPNNVKLECFLTKTHLRFSRFVSVI